VGKKLTCFSAERSLVGARYMRAIIILSAKEGFGMGVFLVSGKVGMRWVCR
jgi:hypothetical protein